MRSGDRSAPSPPRSTARRLRPAGFLLLAAVPGVTLGFEHLLAWALASVVLAGRLLWHLADRRVRRIVTLPLDRPPAG